MHIDTDLDRHCRVSFPELGISRVYLTNERCFRRSWLVGLGGRLSGRAIQHPVHDDHYEAPRVLPGAPATPSAKSGAASMGDRLGCEQAP